MIVAPTGTGKSAIALTAITKIKCKTIITAPPKVISSIIAEQTKWAHLSKLRLVHLVGNPDQRAEKLLLPADVLLVSLNSLNWLLKSKHNCTVIFIDELSKAGGKQSSELKTKKCDGFTRRYGLTATPVANDFEKLFPMLRIIDKGAALGKSKIRYLEQYFYPTDYKRYNWKMQKGAETQILNLVEHLIHDVVTNKAETLPPLVEEEYAFNMPEKTRATYGAMKKDMLIESSTGDVVAVNSAVLSGKLRQISSGFSITEDGDVIEYDNKRAQTLMTLINEDNKPKLILYAYNHQRIQIEKLMAQEEKYFTSVYGGNNNADGIQAFKDGNVKYLIAQESTLSHGVDGLQYAANHLIFFQPCWSNDTTLQAVGRIWRQGSPFKQVTVTTIVCENTVDDLVLTRLESKAENMQMFLNHLRNN